jgi:hypothetical protein
MRRLRGWLGQRAGLITLCAVLLAACADSSARRGDSALAADGNVGKASAPHSSWPLSRVLDPGGTPVELEPVSMSSGCTPALCGPDQIENYDEPAPEGCTPMRCSVRVGAVEWMGETQELRAVQGERIELASAGVGTAATLADRPFAAERVLTSHGEWGLCLALSHEGLGQSGRFQRWVTLLLVPFERGVPRASGSRLTGYWASCEALQLGEGSGEIELPLVEPAGRTEDGLVLNRYRCAQSGCSRLPGDAPIRVEVDESGELRRRK